MRTVMADCLLDTNISKFLPARNNIMGSGKMLRAQLTLHLGSVNGIDEKTCIHSAAAVEIIHGASLLHDDVIDGGVLRRSAPTFWKKHGTNGAILLGDLLVFKGLHLLIQVDRTDLLQELIAMCTLVCRSEVEQELILRGSPGTWAECEKIARAKTGSLFAFAAAAAATDAPGQLDALREAGFILGTAYQLVDDILDISGNEEVSGKTLGKDQERGKTTAITATKNAPKNPIAYVDLLLDSSSAQLAAWPKLRANWDEFLNVTMKPVLSKHLGSV
ncbi:MAG: polyprenyl synthetase family protein [Kiritimatiellales bacterium]|nr:polyprenyl synthetase family protein [Kiritimatiellales bacterium]